jgi:hypothetical protein
MSNAEQSSSRHETLSVRCDISVPMSSQAVSGATREGRANAMALG